VTVLGIIVGFILLGYVLAVGAVLFNALCIPPRDDAELHAAADRAEARRCSAIGSDLGYWADQQAARDNQQRREQGRGGQDA
jgi:hypothetical protein